MMRWGALEAGDKGGEGGEGVLWLDYVYGLEGGGQDWVCGYADYVIYVRGAGLCMSIMRNAFNGQIMAI